MVQLIVATAWFVLIALGVVVEGAYDLRRQKKRAAERERLARIERNRREMFNELMKL